MAKRFIETNFFTDSWISELKSSHKLFFVYLFTNCDHAGIIDFSGKVAEFQTDIKGLAKGFETLYKNEFNKKLIKLRDNYYFIPGFIKVQYPKGLKSSVKAQLSVINRLKEFDLLDENGRVRKGLSNSSVTVQDKDKDQDKDLDKDQDKDLDKDQDKDLNKIKHKYGEYKNVLLSNDEYSKLKNKYSDKLNNMIKNLDEGIEQKGYKYKSHYLTIIKWNENLNFNYFKNNNKSFGYQNLQPEDFLSQLNMDLKNG